MSKPKYRQVQAPAEYPGSTYGDGRVLEHHLVWWQHTGQLVPSGYVVHHRNGDGKDNCIGNLELKGRGQHTTEHRLKGALKTEIVCALCGVRFERLSRRVRARRKLGGKLQFCSISHAVEYQHKASRRKWKHGTNNGYTYHSCRCAACTNAHRVYMNEYNKRKRIRQYSRP